MIGNRHSSLLGPLVLARPCIQAKDPHRVLARVVSVKKPPPSARVTSFDPSITPIGSRVVVQQAAAPPDWRIPAPCLPHRCRYMTRTVAIGDPMMTLVPAEESR